MSLDTGEARPGREPVAYQSISLSDEDEEKQQEVFGEQRNAASQENAPKALLQNTSSTFTNLRKIDEICGQVSRANIAKGNGSNVEAGLEKGVIGHQNNEPIEDDADGEGGSAHNEGQKDNGFEALDSPADILDANTYSPRQNNDGMDDVMEDDGDLDNAEDTESDGNITSDEANERVNTGKDSEENTISVDVPTYTCKLCKVEFKVQHRVESHLMVEHDLGEQTALFNILPPEKKKRRTWRKEKDGYVHCLFCHHRSRRSINVREHERQKHQNEELPAKVYSCKLCGQHFALQEIFSHVQSNHPSEADSMNFVGNSLTEHYSVNFTTERRQIPAGDHNVDEAETLELSEDGLYHCGKCDFCSPELSAFTEHCKEHSLSNAAASCGTYNYCQQCPYKTKSLRGLRQHEKMQHVTASVKKRQTMCLACGEKRLLNHVHKCSKAAKRGRKPSLLRNPEGHLMCADCTFTAKEYNSMYIHTKGYDHQVQRDPSVGHRAPTPKLVEMEEISDSPRLLRGKKIDGTTMNADATKSKTNGDGGDSVEGDEDDASDGALALAIQEMNESDYSQQSNIDDSDDDPEWAPSLKGTPPRKTGRRSKASLSGSDDDSPSPTFMRKRSPSDDENGHASKRRRLGDIPKDPNSPAPKKLENGMFGCNFCEFESKYGQSTEAHQWRHTGFKPYSCETCSKGFRQRLKLEKHKCPGTPPSIGNTGMVPSETLELSSATLLTAGDAVPMNQSDTVVTLDKQHQTPGVETPRESAAGGKPHDHPTPTETAALGNEESQKEPPESPTTVDRAISEVTSPLPIIIAPPLTIESGTLNGGIMGLLGNNRNDGRDISQAIDLDDDNDDDAGMVCNLDGNEDMPPPAQTPPQGLHHLMGGAGQVGMTSPVGTPLNITPIPGMEHHNPHMGGMGHYPPPEGPRFSMGHNPPSMMDMPVPDHMMNPMPGMMGEGNLMHHHGTSPLPLGLQHPDPAAMHHHHMNPIGVHGMLDGGSHFQNPDVGILDHLNLVPNAMLPPSVGFSVPQPPLPLSQLDSNMMPMNNNQFGSVQLPLYNNSIPSAFGNIGNTDPIDVDAEPISAFTPPATSSQSGFEHMPQSTTPIDSMIDMNRLDANAATQSPDKFDMNPPVSNASIHESMPVNTTVGENSQPELNVAPITESTPGGQVPPGTVASSPVPVLSGTVGSISSPLSSASTPPLRSQTATPSADVAVDPTAAPTKSPLLTETTDPLCIAPELGTSSLTPTSDMASPNVQTPPQPTTSVANTETSSTTSSHGNQASDTEGTAGVPHMAVNSVENTMDTESALGMDIALGMESTPGTRNSPDTCSAVESETTPGTETTPSTETAPGMESTLNAESAPGVENPLSMNSGPGTAEGAVTPGATGIEGRGGVSDGGESDIDNQGQTVTANAEQLPEQSGTPPVVSATEVSSVAPTIVSTIPGGIALSGTDEAPPPLTISGVTGTLPIAVSSSLVAKAATNESGKTINDLFKCILCRVYFEDQQMYRNHMVHHGGAIGTCRICGRMFRTPLLFMNHLHCSAQCKGVNVNAPVPQMPMRGRGRGRGAAAQTIARQQMYSVGQIPGTQGRMRVASPMQTTSMINPSRMSTTSMRGTSPLQAMRQMSPATGRRGRPPVGGRGGGAYGAALMRQPLQQQHFSAQLQQMGAMGAIRGRPSTPRPTSMPQQTPRRQRPPPQQEDIVIVID